MGERFDQHNDPTLIEELSVYKLRIREIAESNRRIILDLAAKLEAQGQIPKSDILETVCRELGDIIPVERLVKVLTEAGYGTDWRK